MLWLFYCCPLLFQLVRKFHHYVFSLFSHCLYISYVVVTDYIVAYYCLKFDRGVVYIVATGYIVDHYYIRFDRGVVHLVVVVILLTITV